MSPEISITHERDVKNKKYFTIQLINVNRVD